MLDDDFEVADTGQPGGHHIVLLAKRDELAPNHPGKSRPADEGQNDGDVQVHGGHGDPGRNGGGEGHPQRDAGNGGKHLDDALDHVVNHTAEVAGDTAKQYSQHEADGRRHEGHRQGHPGAEQDAGEDARAGAVRAEDVDAGGIVRLSCLIHQAEQVAVGGEEPQELVLDALGEEVDVVPLLHVFPDLHGEGFLVVVLFQLEHIGAGEIALHIPPIDLGGGGVLVKGGEFLQAIGGDEIGEERAQVQHRKQGQGELGQGVLLEFAPHQRPLGSQVIGLVQFLFLLFQQDHILSSFPRTGSWDPAMPERCRRAMCPPRPEPPE